MPLIHELVPRDNIDVTLKFIIILVIIYCTDIPGFFSFVTSPESMLVVLTPPVYTGGDFLWKFSVYLLRDQYVSSHTRSIILETYFIDEHHLAELLLAQYH